MVFSRLLDTFEATIQLETTFDIDIIWEKTGSFVFPGEEDSEDLASVAAEWVFINSKY